MTNEYAEETSKRIEKLYYSRFVSGNEKEVIQNLNELVEIEGEIEMEVFEALSIEAQEIIQELQKLEKEE